MFICNHIFQKENPLNIRNFYHITYNQRTNLCILVSFCVLSARFKSNNNISMVIKNVTYFTFYLNKVTRQLRLSDNG